MNRIEAACGQQRLGMFPASADAQVKDALMNPGHELGVDAQPSDPDTQQKGNP